MKKIPVGENGLFALVDDEDYDDLIQFKWTAVASKNARTLYARRRWNNGSVRKTEMMHTKITGYNMVDHINQNGLDNRRTNLRSTDRSGNSANRKKYLGSYSSQYKGVTLDKRSMKWRARIGLDKGRISLGSYSTEEGAARAYDAAAKKYFGEFAYCNFLKN